MSVASDKHKTLNNYCGVVRESVLSFCYSSYYVRSFIIMDLSFLDDIVTSPDVVNTDLLPKQLGLFELPQEAKVCNCFWIKLLCFVSSFGKFN